MKKKLFLLLSLFLLLGLSSCSSDESQVKAIDIKLTDENYAYVLKKGNIELQEDFNEFLIGIQEDGTFNELVAKYFEGVGEVKGVPYETGSVENTKDKFVVATNCPFSPFEYLGTDGLIYGLDIEIAALYAEKNDLELIVKNIDFDSIFTEVDSGYADIGMAGITITDSRAQLYDFTTAYYEASQKLIVAADNAMFDNCKTAEDVENVLKTIENEKLGYQIGTTGNWYVVGDDYWGFEGFANFSSKGYKTAQLAIQDIANGQLFGVIVDEAPGKIMVEAINSVGSWESKINVFIDACKNTQFQKLILTGLGNTVLIAVLGLLIGIVVGTLIAIVDVSPKRKKVTKILGKICSFYVTMFRGTPMVVQLLISYYVILPVLGIEGVEPLRVGIVVFGLNSGAYVSEIMRGGINSIDKGQLEAGRALGLSYRTTMIKIVIPQAIKNILPTLGNEFITLVKETSVVSFITVVDLYTAFNAIGTNTYSVVVPYIVMAFIYIILVAFISLLIKLLEKGLAKSDKRY